jgi:hypothetical protein
MTQVNPQEARLAFKRAFAAYFVELNSAGIADPTEAFSLCRGYLSALLGQLGPHEFMRRLDDETTHLSGQIEQDLRHHRKGYESAPDLLKYEDVEDRVRECFEQGLRQLDLEPDSD